MALPKIVIDEVNIGGTATEYIIRQLDCPKIDYGFKIEEDAPPATTMANEIKTFYSGLRFYARIEFWGDYDDECSTFWSEVLRAAVRGAKIYFFPDAEREENYEVMLTVDSRRRFEENSMRLVDGVYEFVAKKTIFSRRI
ncbi:MAG: hypothetical protein ABIK73_06750 [candidate division WOR-3 bacterium]